MNHKKISFITTFNAGKPDEVFIMIDGWQLKNGLIAGHLLEANDGLYNYAPGWVIYHRTGAIVKTAFDGKGHKTPGEALNFVRNACGHMGPGRHILTQLRAHDNDPLPLCDCPAEVVGKLKPIPKPKTAPVIKPGSNALIALLADIDYAITQAYRTSDKHVTFKINRAQFTVGASLENLTRFRVQVIKNRKAFTDNAFQQPKKAVASAAPLTVPELVENCFYWNSLIPQFIPERMAA